MQHQLLKSSAKVCDCSIIDDWQQGAKEGDRVRERERFVRETRWTGLVCMWINAKCCKSSNVQMFANIWSTDFPSSYYFLFFFPPPLPKACQEEEVKNTKPLPSAVVDKVLYIYI